MKVKCHTFLIQSLPTNLLMDKQNRNCCWIPPIQWTWFYIVAQWSAWTDGKSLRQCAIRLIGTTLKMKW